MGHRGLVRSAADAHGERVYEMAGADPARPPGPFRLIRDIGGDVGIYEGTRLERGQAVLRRMRGGDWRVEVHGDLELPDAAVALARGLARWYVAALCVPACELVPEELAAALLLPTAALRIATELIDMTVADVAEAFVVPVRLAEVRLRHCLYQPTRSGTYARVWDVDRAHEH